MATKNATITIQGMSPIVMSRFPIEGTPKQFEKQPPEVQAEHFCYRDKDTGDLYWPARNMYQCIVEAGSYIVWQRTTKLRKPLAACLAIGPEKISFGTKTYSIETKSVVNQNTQGRIVVHKPKLTDWKLTFKASWDDELVADNLFKDALNKAGLLVGMGDHRPAREGPNGRFRVAEFKPEK